MDNLKTKNLVDVVTLADIKKMDISARDRFKLYLHVMDNRFTPWCIEHDVSLSAVCRWLKGDCVLTARNALKIEKHTSGTVTADSILKEIHSDISGVETDLAFLKRLNIAKSR